ncbi:MAG: hypothetical protein EBR09_16595 [Proteobacteria bacterium]|nr:hypothetical protein [Pseudomonadota bacterium]
MKKSLKIFATTTASTLLASMATSCGKEETKQDSKTEQTSDNENSSKEITEEKFEIALRSMQGGLDIVRCDFKCRPNDR